MGSDVTLPGTGPIPDYPRIPILGGDMPKKKFTQVMVGPRRQQQLRLLAKERLAVVLRPGQQWHLADAATDVATPDWNNKRPPRRLTLTDVQLGSYAVLTKEWSKPIDPEFFVRGFYKLVRDNDGEPEQIAYRRLPALSIQQPWAWAILSGFKTVENRTWMPPRKIIGSSIWIHAPKKFDSMGIKKMKQLGIPGVPPKKEFTREAIIGAVRVTRVVDHMSDVWFTGPKGWLLERPVPLPEPVEMPGNQKLWMPEFYRR